MSFSNFPGGMHFMLGLMWIPRTIPKDLLKGIYQLCHNLAIIWIISHNLNLKFKNRNQSNSGVKNASIRFPVIQHKKIRRQTTIRCEKVAGHTSSEVVLLSPSIGSSIIGAIPPCSRAFSSLATRLPVAEAISSRLSCSLTSSGLSSSP